MSKNDNGLLVLGGLAVGFYLLNKNNATLVKGISGASKKNIICYKQINFKRDYETTNVKFIKVLDGSVLDPKYWVVCKESEIDCSQLWIEGDRILYGYL